MTARDDILHRLRSTLAQPKLRFPSSEPPPPPATMHMAVTTANR